MEYPLNHLRSFRVVVPAQDPLAAPAVLQVTFSNHVYTEKWDPGVHTLDRLIVEKGEERAFCPVGYGCSIVLPQLINSHVTGKAFEGRDSKGARNHFFYAQADSISYPIYFRLGPAGRIPGAHGILHIISAYQNPRLPARHRFQAIKFARLVHQTCPPA
ncbi:MAG TPA: hypothetical protein VF655_00215 [Allosphingosinicella sp.]